MNNDAEISEFIQLLKFKYGTYKNGEIVLDNAILDNCMMGDKRTILRKMLSEVIPKFNVEMLDTNIIKDDEFIIEYIKDNINRIVEKVDERIIKIENDISINQYIFEIPNENIGIFYTSTINKDNTGNKIILLIIDSMQMAINVAFEPLMNRLSICTKNFDYSDTFLGYIEKDQPNLKEILDIATDRYKEIYKKR